MTLSPLGVGQTTDQESAGRRSAVRAGLTPGRHLAPAVVLVVAIAGVAAAGIWWFDRLSSEWRMGLGLGGGLLAVAALLGGLFVASSRRELATAEHLLRAAAGDLTNAYRELAEAHQQLAETAEARDRALIRLQAATRDREVFLASVAHDLKSPLTVIKGHTDLLAARLTSGNPIDPSRFATGLTLISAGVGQLSGLVEELLWLARLEIDRAPEARREPADLVALARRMVEERAATAPRHRIVCESAAPALIGFWDPARLERILANLLANAIKYSPSGGDVRINVGQEDAGATAVVTVVDAGVGIPESDLPHVFERFYRGGNVGEHTPGSGLGLASVRQIVDGLGGAVEIASREGSGTTVTVRLPTAPANEPVADPR
jgi:signal transduction histidine kinase